MRNLDNRFRKGLSARIPEWKSAQELEATQEWNPITPPVLTNRGTLQTISGGLPQFRSVSGTSGGTIIMDVDPATGTVTIRGGLVAQQTLDLGTINNTVLAGTPTLAGTLTNNRLINNGTWNTGTFGTPNISAGTHNNAFLGTPQTAGGTIGTPVITGTPTFGTQGGSAALSADGNFAMQFYSGSPIIAFRYAGTTFRFVTAGTI